MTAFATHAIGDADTVYVSGADGPSSAIWRLDARDARAAWSYAWGDSVREAWPTTAGDKVYLVDDGVNVVTRPRDAGARRSSTRGARASATASGSSRRTTGTSTATAST